MVKKFPFKDAKKGIFFNQMEFRKRSNIPKMTEESDLGLSQSPGDERSHLACIPYTGDDAIDSSAEAFASSRNRFFSHFRYRIRGIGRFCLALFFLFKMEEGCAAKKTLVILTGTIRGSAIAHESLHRHLLLPHNADLFLCTEASSDHSSPLYALATYLEEYPSIEDPRLFADGLSLRLFGDTKWRQYPEGFLGNSLIGKYDETDRWTGLGTGLLTLCVRRHALQWLLERNLIDQYDQFVISRTDLYYLADHPDISKLLARNNHVAIPFIHAQGWIPDRHAVTDKEGIVPYLGAVDLFFQADPWIPYQTIEQVLYTSLFNVYGLSPARYLSPTYAVRADADGLCTWSVGKERDCNGLWIKDPGDYQEALLYLQYQSLLPYRFGN